MTFFGNFFWRIEAGSFWFSKGYAIDIYLFKVTNRNARTRCEICSKLIIKTPERRVAASKR